MEIIEGDRHIQRVAAGATQTQKKHQGDLTSKQHTLNTHTLTLFKSRQADKQTN